MRCKACNKRLQSERFSNKQDQTPEDLCYLCRKAISAAEYEYDHDYEHEELTTDVFEGLVLD